MLWLFVVLTLLSIASIDCYQCVVNSPDKWNDCGTTISKGTVVSIVVEGDQTWTDWYIETTADGYANTLHVPTRHQSANLFELVCCINRKESTCSTIGSGNTFTAVEDGIISCYANDVDSFYWNNIGSITVTIE